jgi:hypothetical protein
LIASQPGWFHHILLSNLTPGVPTTVTFGQGLHVNSTTFSPMPTFNQTDKFGALIDVVTFAVVGGMGVHPTPEGDLTAAALSAWVDKGNLSFVLHVGDLAMAAGHTFIWDIFHTIIEPIASRIPYVVVAGTSEVDIMQSTCLAADPSGQQSFFHPTWGNMGPHNGTQRNDTDR